MDTNTQKSVKTSFPYKWAVIFACVASAMISGWFIYSLRAGTFSSNPTQRVSIFTPAQEVLNWCARIHHTSPCCPEYSNVLKVFSAVPRRHTVPTLDNNDPWCERIYHQNPSCPKYGQVTIPDSVLHEGCRDEMTWCDRINHANVACPLHKDDQ